ncbi:hypothetical protein [Sediminibacillus albus]|uniref:Uncharacterized protein n=1 Tax=Sediminibacillus albus TaxID=407036 RepID=A0A1G8ZUC9_9BACI|nr:hypothetical protein [Sediminibacillus albus]SDK18611.1 hypothetical protein SAMN05216243_2227 [Sediminibacillus albus]
MVRKNPAVNLVYLGIFSIFATFIIFKVILVNPKTYDYFLVGAFYLALVSMFFWQLKQLKKQKNNS